jgi:predicted GNAT family acetyltransferase
MIVKTYPSADQFLLRVQPSLEKNEAVHNLLLGLSLLLARQPDFFGSTPFFVTVETDSSAGTGALCLAGLQTPPFNLILGSETGAYPETLPLLVQHLLEGQPDLAGVLAVSPLAEAFAGLWSERSGRSSRLTMRERVYELRRVNPVRGIPGRLRPAEEADLGLISEWTRAFNLEALGIDDPQAAPIQRLRSRLPDTYLWEAGQAASMACVVRYTPHGAVVGMVYTPPEQRGHGYASALVAALSQRLLDSGCRFCALFTNLANPTSNHIYQEIGYQPGEDFSNFEFG